MRQSIWAFDLDGTLIATMEINRQAYETVGVKMPARAAGLSWVEWLPEYCGGNYDIAATLHRQKTSIYLRRLIETDLQGMTLPALHIAQELYADNPTKVKLVTAASQLSTRRMINRFGLDTIEYTAELTYDKRLTQLRTWDFFYDVTYVDDSAQTIEKLKIDAPNLNLIHYIDQDLNTLKKQMGVPTWTQ